MIWNELVTERNRHRRALFYVCVSFVLAVFGYVVLGFDRTTTLGYGIVAYITLNALNYRAMFGPVLDARRDNDESR